MLHLENVSSRLCTTDRLDELSVQVKIIDISFYVNERVFLVVVAAVVFVFFFVALVQIRSKYCEILELVENSVSLVSPLKCSNALKPLAVPTLYLYVCF